MDYLMAYYVGDTWFLGEPEYLGSKEEDDDMFLCHAVTWQNVTVPRPAGLESVLFLQSVPAKGGSVRLLRDRIAAAMEPNDVLAKLYWEHRAKMAGLSVSGDEQCSGGA